jgi:hypothetical protein
MTPQYVVTKAPGFVLGDTFGKLWKLADNKWARDKNLIYYDQIAEGKLEDLAKLAQEMNQAMEPKAETAKVEEEPKVSVGIPTVVESVQQSPYLRPGWEPLWLLGELERTLELSNGGKINLPQFRHHIESIVRQMKEDIPK